jgi:hypothetical protein
VCVLCWGAGGGAMAVEVFGCRSVLVWWILSELWGFGSTLVESEDD